MRPPRCYLRDARWRRMALYFFRTDYRVTTVTYLGSISVTRGLEALLREWLPKKRGLRRDWADHIPIGLCLDAARLVDIGLFDGFEFLQPADERMGRRVGLFLGFR